MSPEHDGKSLDRITDILVTTPIDETPSYSATDRARFWAKVDKADGGCWLWTGSTNPRNGYGQFVVGSRRSIVFNLRTHRVAWELTNGPIPDDTHVLHACDVARCVNPAHLFLGTHRDNMADAAKKGRLHVQRPRKQRISAEAVARIRPMRAAGATLQTIADAIGATKTFVSLVLSGKRRQHPHPRSAAQEVSHVEA